MVILEGVRFLMRQVLIYTCAWTPEQGSSKLRHAPPQGTATVLVLGAKNHPAFSGGGGLDFEYFM